MCVLTNEKETKRMKLQKPLKNRLYKKLGGVQRLNQYHSKCLKQ